jgi:hypothetical protein
MLRGVCAVLFLLGLLAGSAKNEAVAGARHPVQLSAPVRAAHTFRLPVGATHVAPHWRGSPGSHVRISLSRDGRRFDGAVAVQRDEAGEARSGSETYGALIVVRGARFARVFTDRPIRRLTLLTLADRGPRASPGRALASYAQPRVIPRSGWGADESLRFDATGKEIWPPAFYPIQKVIVHHTATTNGDPNPAATIRSIYYYHAVTQGWGDVGYNFMIDEAGNVYEGRYSRAYGPEESPTGEDLSGNGVTAAHVQGYNSGTVGIALLGTLANQDATPAAPGALERLIAWIDSTHAIDPQGSSLYTNPVSGLQATFPNIAGHRDLAATECPGGVFYATLPTIRSDVAASSVALVVTQPPPPPAPDFALSAAPASESIVRGLAATYTVSVSPSGGFSSAVTLGVTGLPAGTTATYSPNPTSTTSTLTVRTTPTTKTGNYTLTISGTVGALAHTTTVTLQVRRK